MKSSLLEKTLLVETPERMGGVRVGKVVHSDENGQVWVEFPGNGKAPVAARLTTSVKAKAPFPEKLIRSEVLLVFENNDPGLPIIIDTMHSLLDEVSESLPSTVVEGQKPDDVLMDGKRVVFNAEEEVTIRCGKSSITLTRAGKILIRGAYLLSRSSGVNRIKGGSVQIN